MPFCTHMVRNIAGLLIAVGKGDAARRGGRCSPGAAARAGYGAGREPVPGRGALPGGCSRPPAAGALMPIGYDLGP
jgi:hypothetical protein